MTYGIPVPVAVVEMVDQYVSAEYREASKFSNRAVLDESGAYSLHGLAAELYARGYQDGRMAERARADGERRRERDLAGDGKKNGSQVPDRSGS